MAVMLFGVPLTASADLTDDLHDDLVEQSLDWPVGHVSPLRLSSGMMDNPEGQSKVVYEDVITYPGMAWMRLYFGDVSPGRRAAEAGRPHDGHVEQYLGLLQW